MVDDEVPIRFELCVNDEPPVTGGVKYGTTYLSLACVTHNPDRIEKSLLDGSQFTQEQFLHGELGLTYTTLPEKSDERLQWIPYRQIAVGDQITVRVIGPGPVDEPSSREDPLADEYFPPDGSNVMELRDAEAAYDETIDALFGAISTPNDEFRVAMQRCSGAKKRYKRALSAAFNESEGEDRSLYREEYSRLKRSFGELTTAMMWHRSRMGYGKQESSEPVDD